MFTLVFHKSRSKNYKLVLSLAEKFSEHKFENDVHTIELSIKETFEKWDYFNLIFWKTVDWKEQTFGFDGWHLHAHAEKTRIFYGLQDAYTQWICMSERYVRNIAPAYYSKEMLNEIRDDAYNEVAVDRFLDGLRIAKYQELFQYEYGYIKPEVHFCISDFGRKRAVLNAMEEEKRKKKEEGF